ncbi:MAG: ATPase, T2SS/T4P/T4SS family [Planctomycetota bacterium]|jgi:excisionase family DNA binding protein
MAKEDYLSPAELRQVLGISQATYYRWLKEGKLRGVRAGRTWRFPKSLAQDLLREGDPGVEEARRICQERLGTLSGPGEEMTPLPDDLSDLLIEHALRRQATDLHIEPVADGVAVRERVHGILAPVEPALPAGAQTAVVSALKERAGLEAPPGRPQQGRFFHAFEGRRVDVRASTYPTGLGESVTLRLLDPATITVDLDALGFGEKLVAATRQLLRSARGVLLVNGPTGAGKSTTLYSFLKELTVPGRKVMTAEDPVELHLDGLLQANVGPEMGFCDAMYAMLRNDLDVGMVSEVRDGQTMRLLFQVANTGHLMLSALHAPDAASALHRLLGLGEVEPRLVVENLLGVLDQRLLARVCPSCRVSRRPTREHAEWLSLNDAQRRRTVAYGEGCQKCDDTGVAGRTAVGVLLTLDRGLKAAIEAGTTSPEELEALLPEDYRGLRKAVLDRLFAGEVTPQAAATALGSVAGSASPGA